MKVQFYPIEISYTTVNNKAAIMLYGRTAKGEQIAVMDDSFLPYFWVIAKEDGEAVSKRIGSLKVEYKGNPIVITGTEIAKKSYLGKEVNAIKVYTRFPKDVSTLRSKVRELSGVADVLEADISFVNRYLIDRRITPLTLTNVEGDGIKLRNKVPVVKAEKIDQTEEVTLKEPRVLAFDIETYSPSKGRVLADENPILMIAFYGKEFRKVITWKKFKTDLDYVEFVKSEAELLQRVKEVIDVYKPDILTGYFSDGFDVPYIKTRADKYRVNLDIGLDYTAFTSSKGRKNNASLAGIVHIDIFEFIYRIFARTLETDSYSLDSVAQELLGKGKNEVDLGDLVNIWDNNPEKLGQFCEYNLQDALLTYELCEKVFPNMKELVKIVGAPLFDVTRMGFSKLVEWYTIKQSHYYDELCPSKPTHDQVKTRRLTSFKGGFVHKPTPGVYGDIVILDFRSLYAAIISAYNISPASLDCDCCKDIAEKAPIEGEVHWFCEKKKALIPSLVKDLVTRRMRIKEIMATTKRKDKKYMLLHARQDALKILGNSFWGYYGFFGARWYSLPCAKAITSWARHYMHQIIDMAFKNDLKVIYGDTDGVFLTLGDKKLEDVKDFVYQVNKTIPEMMELEIRGHYPKGIFVSARLSPYGAKKKYALLREDKSIEVKGFAIVRRDWSDIAKETQEKILGYILKDGKPAKALEYVQKVIHDLRSKKVPLSKVVIHTQLQKDLDDYEQIGPHVAVARKMAEKGIAVGVGSLITYVIKEGKEMIRDRAAMPDEVKEGGYDPNYYINNQVVPAVETILNVLGYTSDDILEHKEQSKLDKFFK